MSGMGRKLPGSGSTSRKHPNKADGSSQWSTAAYQNTQTLDWNLAQRSFYNLVMNPHMTDSRTLDELARDNSLANNDEGASGEEEEEEEGNEGTNDGDYSEENEEEEEGTDGNEE
ncbi:hypothetical protein Tco_1538246 [Tanacetum coccineum]